MGRSATERWEREICNSRGKWWRGGREYEKGEGQQDRSSKGWARGRERERMMKGEPGRGERRGKLSPFNYHLEATKYHHASKCGSMWVEWVSFNGMNSCHASIFASLHVPGSVFLPPIFAHPFRFHPLSLSLSPSHTTGTCLDRNEWLEISNVTILKGNLKWKCNGDFPFSSLSPIHVILFSRTQ